MSLLFIFESIGTSELILIGIVALIVFGPRKLPGLARSAGKLMSDFRNTTNEFKETWQKEVDLEKLEAKEQPKTIAKSTAVSAEGAGIVPPLITNVDEASIADHFKAENRDDDQPENPEASVDSNLVEDKKNWV